MDEHVGTAATPPRPSAVPARPVPGPSQARPVSGAATSEPEGADTGTGDHAVDQAMTRLATLDDAPLREHVGVFDAVHTALQDRLADAEA
jgi:hypothetical protein